MTIIQEIHADLTSLLPLGNCKDNIYRFATECGWTPGYYMDPSSDESIFSNGYLSIENGLENTAVLAFLKKPFNGLSYDEKRKLYNLSYNNLVNWLISIDNERITYSYILNVDYDKSIVEEKRIEIGSDYHTLRSEAFETVIGKRPSPNIKPLDDVLIANITRWRVMISSELNNNVSLVELSALFNAIIFTRAIEDNNKRYHNLSDSERTLIESVLPEKSVYDIFVSATTKLGYENVPSDYLNEELLRKFNDLNKILLKQIFQSFYNTEQGFRYDFSIISKHALSRVYEKYVTGLQLTGNYTPNLFGFNEIPHESLARKSSGTYYTPEYIARFFAKYILYRMPYNKVEVAQILEPSVGSGIFLRSFLELYVERYNPDFDKKECKDIFDRITALDIDENACQATRLSISLLYMLLFQEIPTININSTDSLTYLTEGEHKYDIIISNPPYVRYESMPDNTKNFFNNHLKEFIKGKSDLYLGFLKVCIDNLNEGGLGLFIIPHNFLINNNAALIRKYISKMCHLKLIADLSNIPVFGDVGTYSILMIVEKKQSSDDVKHNTTVLKCNSNVGKALEDIISGNYVTNEYYSIYEVCSSVFSDESWLMLPKQEYNIETRIKQLPIISNFLDVNTGIISGGDNVFIREKYSIPSGEEMLYKPFLPDKQMTIYHVPSESDSYIFYHDSTEGALSEEELENTYPKTWHYLNQHKEQLERRKSQPQKWWMLRSIGKYKTMFSPKIITPELAVMPKFALDIDGKYVVSHSCYLTLKKSYDNNIDLLYYFLGILNSTVCFWYISNHANKYGGNYSKLQGKTIRQTPIPDPFLINKVDKISLIKFIKLVQNRLLTTDYNLILSLDREIDEMSCKFYGLSDDEIGIILG